MFNFDYITKGDIKYHNLNWPEIPDHPYRILIIGSSGSGKTNTFFNVINHEPDIDQSYLDAKDQYEANYLLLIKKEKDEKDRLKVLQKIQKILLNIQMIWMIFMKILKNRTQTKNKEY